MRAVLTGMGILLLLSIALRGCQLLTPVSYHLTLTSISFFLAYSPFYHIVIKGVLKRVCSKKGAVPVFLREAPHSLLQKQSAHPATAQKMPIPSPSPDGDSSAVKAVPLTIRKGYQNFQHKSLPSCHSSSAFRALLLKAGCS